MQHATNQTARVAGRAAASVIMVAGLPDLIGSNLAEDERIALELARDPARLAALMTRLQDNRLAMPLLDTIRSCGELEAACTRMWELAVRAQARRSFDGAALPGRRRDRQPES